MSTINHSQTFKEIFKDIKAVIFDMDGVMNGKIQKFVDELQLVNNMEKLKESEVF